MKIATGGSVSRELPTFKEKGISFRWTNYSGGSAARELPTSMEKGIILDRTLALEAAPQGIPGFKGPANRTDFILNSYVSPKYACISLKARAFHLNTNCFDTQHTCFTTVCLAFA